MLSIILAICSGEFLYKVPINFYCQIICFLIVLRRFPHQFDISKFVAGRHLHRLNPEYVLLMQIKFNYYSTYHDQHK